MSFVGYRAVFHFANKYKKVDNHATNSQSFCTFAGKGLSIMYDQIREDILFIILYSVVTAMALMASCYLELLQNTHLLKRK